jgi:uncharacterized protein YjdB
MKGCVMRNMSNNFSLGRKLKGLSKRIAAGVLAAMLGLSAGTYCNYDASVVKANTNATLALNDTYVQGEILKGGDSDFYQITLPSAGWLTITLWAGSIGRGGFALLTDDLGTEYLSTNAPASSEQNPQTATKTITLDKGTYKIKVYGRWSDTIGQYKIKASFKAAGNDETEPNNYFEEAMLLNPDTKVTGFLHTDDKLDFYKIVLPKAMTVRLTMISRAYHTQYSFWDSDCVIIGNSYDMGTASEENPVSKTTDINLNAGINYVKVEGRWGDKGRYQIKWSEAPTPVTNIGITGKTTGRAGETISLKANILPSNATNKTLKWSSFDTSIATVDQSGKVRLKKDGTVTIKAEATDDSGISSTILLTVKPAIHKVTKVTISGEKTLKVGSSIKLSAKVSPSNATNKKVKWSTTKKNIATVSSTGKVTAKAAGKVTIIATAADGSGVSGSYDIVVKSKKSDFDASKSVKKTSSVKARAIGNKKVKVNWKKQSAANKYEIQVATNKKFTSNLLVKNAAKSKDNITIKYKKTGTVYIRVRAIDKYGYVGKWSDIKTVKIK